MNPTVSVVIPTRNREVAVVQAVKSALGQTFRDLEVTVVVDGPDPATVSKLEALCVEDERLRVIELERNLGGCAARNRGIKASRGQWIALLDDDDEWLPAKIEKQLSAVRDVDIERNKPIVATKLYALSGDGKSMVWPRTDPTEPLSEYLFCRKSWSYGDAVLQTSTLLAPRSLFLQVPFSTGLKNFQDDDWLLHAIREPGTHIVWVPDPLVVWKIWYDGVSLSNRADWRLALEWIQGCRSIVTKRAYASFIATDVAREACEQKAWGKMPPLLFEMLRHGQPRLFDLFLFFGSWVPNGLRKCIAGIIRS